jgi:YggT family protein
VLAAFVANFARFLFLGLELLILARVILSWTDPAGRGTVAAWVTGMTEPILAPIRRLLPRTGMLDLSPLVVIIAIGLALRIVG